PPAYCDTSDGYTLLTSSNWEFSSTQLCVKLHQTTLEFVDAMSYCERENATLVVLDTQAKYDLMSTVVRKRNTEKSVEPVGPTVAETFSRALTSEAKWTDKVDEEEYGGLSEILKEGLMTSFSSFLVLWILIYSSLHAET
ncbi:RCAF1-like protein, partial [Mya arenaria]